MSDLELVRQLQEDLDEYRRFCGDLLVSLINREHRMFMKHGLRDGSDFFGPIWQEVDKMLDEIAELREQLTKYKPDDNA